MSGYVKLFSSILTSSVWGEADSTRIVWITLLALADRNGEAMASVGGLARSANMERDNCERAIAVLSSPDPDDRSGVRDGVRIEKIQGGWRIINFAAYREKMRAADRTEYLRRKQAESRARRRSVNKQSTSQPCQPLSTGINQDQPIAASSTASTTPKAKDGTILPESLAVDCFVTAWAEWVAYRRSAKFSPWKPVTIQAKWNELAEIGPEAAAAAIRRSIANGWKGIFPENGNGKAATPDRTCTRCAGKGYAEVDADMGSRFNPETQQTERVMKHIPCSRCQSTGRF